MKLLLPLLCAVCAWPAYKEVVIADNCHPAVRSAARIFGLSVKSVANPGVPAAGQIVLVVEPSASVHHDGYHIVFINGGARILATARALCSTPPATTVSGRTAPPAH